MPISEEKAKEIINNNFNIYKITKAQIKNLSGILNFSVEEIEEFIAQIMDARENNSVEDEYIDKFHDMLDMIQTMRPYIESLRSEAARNFDYAKKEVLLKRHED